MSRRAAIRNAAADHCAVADHSAAVDRCAEADRFVVREFHGVALVEIRVVRSVARSVVPNAVRRFSWGDFRSVALAVAQVVARVAALLVFPEKRQASQVVRCVAHSVAEGCYAAAGSLLPAGRADVSQLLVALPVAHTWADPAVLQAGSI